jgi:hypothetical protein
VPGADGGVFFLCVCSNNQNPDFAKKIPIDSYSKLDRELRVAVYDVDNDEGTYTEDDLMGEAFTPLSVFVAAFAPVQFPLCKEGKEVGDAVVLLNPPESAKPDVDLGEVTQTKVRISCR